MMGITGILRTSVRFIDLHRPMQTTSQLLLWVMGRIKGLHRGYAVSYCKTVKDCIALAYTDGSVPISYTLFIKHSAQPTKLQRQSRTVCRDRTFSLIPHRCRHSVIKNCWGAEAPWWQITLRCHTFFMHRIGFRNCGPVMNFPI